MRALCALCVVPCVVLLSHHHARLVPYVLRCNGVHRNKQAPHGFACTNFILLFCRFLSRCSFGVFVLVFSIKPRANVVMYRAAVASAAFILYKVCTRLRLAYARPNALPLVPYTNARKKLRHRPHNFLPCCFHKVKGLSSPQNKNGAVPPSVVGVRGAANTSKNTAFFGMRCKGTAFFSWKIKCRGKIFKNVSFAMRT